MQRTIHPRHERARELRKALTPSERRLWGWLRNRSFAGFKFRRQFSIAGCVLDFFCPELALAIEVDGRQHEQAQIAEQDEARSARLRTLGIRVVRIPNALLARDPLTVEQQIRHWIETSAAKKGLTVPPRPS